MIAASPRARLAILAACLTAGGLALAAAGPPAPRPADAPAGEFSALRARDELAALLGDERPHPVGSAANEAVRGRLVERLRALGLAPEALAAFACTDAGTCAPVTDVIVTIPGARALPAVAITSHYDSVPAGPGAADDGHGVAVDLEVLRILAAEAPHPRPLVAIFTDGEEVGLLGAEALVQSPRIASIAAVVNAEARGTGGASRMFETSAGNQALVAAYAAAAPSPSATSLSYEVYRRLPNDTDLSAFLRAGVAGLNFAFIGGVRRYHTPRDDLAHLDLGSVQHQGEAILASTRALLAAEGPLVSDADLVYADLWGRWLVRWPAPWSGPLFALGLVALAIALARGRRDGALRLGGVALALAAALLAPALAAAAAIGLLAALDALGPPLGPWPTATAPALIAAAAIASAAALTALRLAARRAGAPATALAVGLLWVSAGLALAWTIPGATILFAPALLIGPGLAAGRRRPALAAAALAAAGALAFALWAPLVPALVEALGLAGALVGAPLGLLWGAAAPALAGDRREPVSRALSLATWLLIPVSLVLGGMAWAAPRFTADAPAGVNLLHVEEADGARWVVEARDGWLPELDGHAAWEPAAAALPWSRRPLVSAPAPRLAGDAGPELALAAAPEGDARRLRGRLRARPGALMAILALPAGLRALTIEGRALDPARLRQGPEGRRVVTVFGPPAAGLAIDALVGGEAPWIVADALPGPPAGAGAIAGLRPAHAAPYQWGDQAIVVRRLTP